MKHIKVLKTTLSELSSSEKAEASKRYFTDDFECLGVTANDIKQVATEFQARHSSLTAEQTLSLTEGLLEQAVYHEEKLLAFALLNKFVKKHFDASLLQRFEFWLENYTDNWALVDDLCIKTIYLFLLARPELIHKTRHWANSDVSWCRRASCVVWVKFINRKIGSQVYRLDTKLIFEQCDQLLMDGDVYVQKAVGWLLKVTSVVHQDKVVDYLEQNHTVMSRSTVRYAIEKMDVERRGYILTLS